jgi:hypothetical protein
MGQYYRPTFLGKKNKPISFVRCYDFGSGAKLMEHSWMANDFVGFVEKQLVNQPQKLVWAGDYADKESNIPKAIIKEYIKVNLANDGEKEYYNEKYIDENGLNIYDLTELAVQITDPSITDPYNQKIDLALPKKFKYLINHTKKEFVDKSKVPSNSEGWTIHPLPLLTCEGNGRGGGDFRGEEKDLVGRWSRDEIEVSSVKGDIPKGFTEVVFDIIEEW